MTRTAAAGSSADRLVELENEFASLRNDVQTLRTGAAPPGVAGFGRPARIIGPVGGADNVFDIIFLDGEFTEVAGAQSIVWTDRQAASAAVACNISGSTLAADDEVLVHPWSDRWWIQSGAAATPATNTTVGGGFTGTLSITSGVTIVVPMGLTGAFTALPGVLWHGTPDFVIEFEPSTINNVYEFSWGGFGESQTGTDTAIHLELEEATTLGGTYSNLFTCFLDCDNDTALLSSHSRQMLWVRGASPAGSNFLRFGASRPGTEPNANLLEMNFTLKRAQ